MDGHQAPLLAPARERARKPADAGDFDGARREIAQAIEQAPNDAELHALMAWVTSRCKGLSAPERARLAQHHMEVSHDIARGNPDAHFYQGRMLLDLGNA